MTKAGEDGPLAFEELNGGGGGVGPESFESNKAFSYNIIGLIDDTHAAFAQRSFGDFVATVDGKRLWEGGCHSEARELY